MSEQEGIILGIAIAAVVVAFMGFLLAWVNGSGQKQSERLIATGVIVLVVGVIVAVVFTGITVWDITVISDAETTATQARQIEVEAAELVAEQLQLVQEIAADETQFHLDTVELIRLGTLKLDGEIQDLDLIESLNAKIESLDASIKVFKEAAQKRAADEEIARQKALIDSAPENTTTSNGQ